MVVTLYCEMYRSRPTLLKVSLSACKWVMRPLSNVVDRDGGRVDLIRLRFTAETFGVRLVSGKLYRSLNILEMSSSNSS
jgi:hypothetical protein